MTRLDEPKFLQLGPPMEREALEFEGVTFRVFPLRANPHRLERFCDDYLNLELPEEVGRFRPALPFVMLEVINYGRMSPKASNLGWLAQNEIVFAVPLEWHQKRNGKWVFKDWATVSPFIFVDDDLSTAEGREIYGWPKVLSTIEAEADPWMEDPRSRRRVLTLKTQMFSELFSGQELELRPLMQIEQRLPEVANQWMPDLGNLTRPLLGPGSAALDGLAMLSDFWVNAASRWREVGDLGASGYLEALRRLTRIPPQDLYGNTINLKQFRGSEPHSTCYQALVNARFTFKKFHGGGTLGDVEQLRGDTSGGFRVHLHRRAAYPIVESLGLVVAEEESYEGGDIAVLEPKMPGWFKADTRYEMGKRLAWRIESDSWLTDDGADQEGPRQLPARRNSRVFRQKGTERKPPYNTSLGPVLSAVQEPFDFWDATVRAITLRANPEALQTFVDSRLGKMPTSIGKVTILPPDRLPNQEQGGQWAGYDFKAYAPVLLQISSYGAMSAGSNDIGRWARREVGIAVPVWIQFAGGRTAPLPALFWTHVFSDSPIAVRTDREVTGMPAVQAEIQGGLDPWLDNVDAGRDLLSVSVGAYPALHVGARRRPRKLLSIRGTPPGPPEESLSYHPYMQGEVAVQSLADGIEPIVSELNVIASNDFTHDVNIEPGGVELDHLAVKQFRDAERPGLACYQAIVAARTFIGKWHRKDSPARVEPDPTDYRVFIHQLESHPIVEELGLCVGEPKLAPDGSRVVEVLRYPFVVDGEVLSAFSMVVDLRHHLSRTLCWRGVGSEQWTLVENGVEYLKRRSDQHLRGVNNFGKFFETLRAAVDGTFGLPDHKKEPGE